MTTRCERLDLERFVVGELDREQADAVRHHCESCSDCSSYVAMLQAEKEEFLNKHPFSSFTRAHAPIVELPWYRRITFGMPQPAIVAVGAVFLVTLAVIPVVNNRNAQREDIVRFKGSPPLSFIYNRNGTTQQGNSVGRYREGDKIQITCPPTRFGFVSLLSIDPRGTISFYHPETGSGFCSVPVDSNVPFKFPGSIELDDTPGGELVIVIFSPEKLETATVTEWIRKKFTSVSDLESLNTKLLQEKHFFGGETSTLLLWKE
ncbi:MAG: hypothetical protein JW863_18960 [Chitinispirillaceae bacterium]|nr:hypothetical protein [Chitinispirillaceae bacterium]